MRFLNKSAALAATVGAIIACVVLLVVGISLQNATVQQNQTYTGTVEAVVTDYEVQQQEITDSDEFETTRIVDFYHPVFTYTVDGQEYRVVSDTGTGSKPYETGSTVTLCYLPSDPSRVYVPGDATRNYLPYFLYAMSLVCAVISVKTLLDLRKFRA